MEMSRFPSLQLPLRTRPRVGTSKVGNRHQRLARMWATLVDAAGELPTVERFAFNACDDWTTIKRRAVRTMLPRATSSTHHAPTSSTDVVFTVQGCPVRSVDQLLTAGRRAPLVLHLHRNGSETVQTATVKQRPGAVDGDGDAGRRSQGAGVAARDCRGRVALAGPVPIAPPSSSSSSSPSPPAHSSVSTVDCSWDWRCRACGRTNIVQPLSGCEAFLAATSGRHSLPSTAVLPYVQCSGCAKVREWKCRRGCCGAQAPAVIIKQGGSKF